MPSPIFGPHWTNHVAAGHRDWRGSLDVTVSLPGWFAAIRTGAADRRAEHRRIRRGRHQAVVAGDVARWFGGPLRSSDRS